MSLQNIFLGIAVIATSAYVGLYAAVIFKQRLMAGFKQEEHFKYIAGMAQMIIFMIVFSAIAIELSILRIKLGLVPDSYQQDFPGKVAGIAVNHAIWIIGAWFTGFVMVMNHMISKRHKR